MALFLASGSAWGAMSLTSGDQTIRGQKTFEHNGVFKKNLTVEGALLGVNQYSTEFWVDSTTGNDSSSSRGGSYLKPFATVDYAIDQTTADKGDVIWVMPSHAETIAAADGFDVDVAGVSIVGLGSGNDMPTFTFSAVGSTVAIGAANVTLHNLRFLAGITDVVKGIAIEAAGDGATISNCVFPAPATATVEFLDAIDIATTVDDVTIIGNTYYGASTSLTNHFIEAGAGTNPRLRIIDNFIWGNFAVSAIWSDAIDLLVEVRGNTINNLTAAQHCVEFTTTASGVIEDNLFISATVANTLDPGSTYLKGNKLAFAIDSGPLDFPGTRALRSVVKTDGTVPNGDDALFLVTGGPVRARITGRVTTVIGANAVTLRLQADITDPAGTVELNAGAVTCTDDASGTVYTNIDSTSVFTPTTAGAQIVDDVAAPEAYFIIAPGTVVVASSAANTGAIEWTMTYEALSPNSLVVAAP